MEWYIIFIAVVACIVMSLRTLFKPVRFKYKQVSFENFMFLCCTYTIIMIGFALLFLLLDIRGEQAYIDENISSKHIGATFFQALYLSGITLFSVGFGDVVPLGFARILVLVEAMIGYTIPAAFVVRSYIDYKNMS